ncbi:MAG: Ig-like domain-containing protein [Rhizobiaceae bacterium]
MAITAPAEAREPFTATVTFSEPVTGFEQGELTVQNGTVTAFSGTGATYSFTVTPGEAGGITLQVAADVAADGAGNNNVASEQVTLNYIDEQETQEEAQQVISQLMTHRNRITMDKRPTIRRRLQRLTGGLQNDGSLSAFGLTYKDGRLPVAMNIKEDEVSFSYSLLKSRIQGPAPSLSGRLAVGPFGTVESAKTDAANANEPGRLSDNPGAYLLRNNSEESAAIHDVLFGKDERHAKAAEKEETLELQASQPERLALNQEEFEARYAGAPAGQDDRRLDLWVEGTFGGFDIDGSTGSYGVMHVGADYLYTPKVLLGLSAQIDMVESEHSDDDSSSEGVGFMVGPYATIRLSEELLFDGRVAWGRSSNELTSANAMTDEFDSERWMASAALVGRVDLMDNIAMLPEARLT